MGCWVLAQSNLGNFQQRPQHTNILRGNITIASSWNHTDIVTFSHFIRLSLNQIASADEDGTTLEYKWKRVRQPTWHFYRVIITSPNTLNDMGLPVTFHCVWVCVCELDKVTHYGEGGRAAESSSTSTKRRQTMKIGEVLGSCPHLKRTTANVREPCPGFKTDRQ